MSPAGDFTSLRPRQPQEAHNCEGCDQLQQQLAAERAANLAALQHVYEAGRSDGSEHERRRLGLPAGTASRRTRFTFPRLRG